MSAGPLNKRVTFQVEVNTADGRGGNTRTWSDYATVWGQVTVARGREQLTEGRLLSIVPAILRVRSSAATRAVTTAYRVVIDGVAYQIRAITNPDQRNRFLELAIERGPGT